MLVEHMNVRFVWPFSLEFNLHINQENRNLGYVYTITNSCSFRHEKLSGIVWTPIQYVTLRLRDRRGLASLRYKNPKSPFLRSIHTRRQVAAASSGDRSLRVYRSGDYLQQHVAATHRSDKSLRVCATEFCRRHK